MGFYIVKGDLLEQKVDAIVIPGQTSLKLVGNLGSQIKNRCGELVECELEQLKEIDAIGYGVVINAYNINAKRIIYVANPKWFDGKHNEKQALKDTYTEALYLAQKFNLHSVAFPLLSAGAYGFKTKDALEIALGAINDFVEDNDMGVCLVINKPKTFTYYKHMLDKYKIIDQGTIINEEEYIRSVVREKNNLEWYEPITPELLDKDNASKNFIEMLKTFVAKHGLNPTDAYVGVISKTMYYKILNGAIPDKYTVIALGINMGLYLNEIKQLLYPLGYHFVESDAKDIIIEEAIEGHQTIDDINDKLGKAKYPLLKTHE